MASRLLIAVLAVAATFLCFQTSVFQKLALWTDDTVAEWVAPRFAFEDILIVDIDDQSLDTLAPALGAWPYDRDIFALITEFLHEYGARKIVYDIVFAEQRAGDDEFAEVITRTGKVALAGLAHPTAAESTGDDDYSDRVKSVSWTIKDERDVPPLWNLVLPHPALTRGSSVGIITVIPDSDGVIRRIPLFFETVHSGFPSLALGALFSSRERPALRYAAGGVRAGDFTWPTDKNAAAALKIPRNLADIPAISFHRLVRAAQGGPALNDSVVRNKTIFVGSSAANLRDYASLPGNDLVAGVVILALTYYNLKHELILKPPNIFWNGATVFASLGLLLLVGFGRPDSVRVGAFGLIAVFALGILIHIGLLLVFRQQTTLLAPLLASFLFWLFHLSSTVRRVFLQQRRIDLESQRALGAAPSRPTAAGTTGELPLKGSNNRELQEEQEGQRFLSEINRAVEAGDFELYVQAIVPARPVGAEPYCYEVLLRGTQVTAHHPGAFVQVAERFRVMSLIDRWVINAAIRTVAEIRHRPGMKGLRFAINVSGQSVNDRTLVSYILSQLDRFDVPPETLCVELTETAAVRDIEQAKIFCGALKDVGVEIALDDFGSGFTSYEHLKVLPLDLLKIDGSFVRTMLNDPVNRSIVEAVIDISQRMRLRTVAEHVENEGLRAELDRLGIDYVQGFGIATPRPIADLCR